MALNGWRPGENIIHYKLNTFNDYGVSNLFMSISGDLPPEHAEFNSTCLPFVPVTTLDNLRRPWGRQGREAGVPIENSKLFGRDGPMLVAGIGIDFATRQRKKFARAISRLETANNSAKLEFRVNEAIGNFPKYINGRDLIPHPTAAPSDRLPDEAISFITVSDTVFFGTTYKAQAKDSMIFPSHLGMNQREGQVGFIRVVPSDRRTVMIPDFSGLQHISALPGKRMLTSLR
ncbi:hypothetical protein B0H10DRAFT_2244324 [Mycena sp. CBHHK59/15]|nr:hypothetical protein B0H10DRAFT_2244324 [Mycena sp. CBHHK59/15]